MIKLCRKMDDFGKMRLSEDYRLRNNAFTSQKQRVTDIQCAIEKLMKH